MDNNDGEEICQSYDEEGNDSYSLESQSRGEEQSIPVNAPPRKIFHKTETRRPTFDNSSSFSEYLDIPEDGVLLRTLFVGLRDANDSSKQNFLTGGNAYNTTHISIKFSNGLPSCPWFL